jgi:sugar phosphate isomerase/epimerase
VRRMKYGVQLFGCSREFRRNTDNFFAEMKNAGLYQIEPCIMFDDPDIFRANALAAGNSFAASFPDILWLPDEVERFIAVMKPMGLYLTSAHVFASSLTDALPKMLETAKKNGIKAYVINTPEYAINEPDKFAETLTYISEQLAEIGTELWLHNSGKDFTSKISLNGKTVPVYEYILRKAKNVYAQVDTGWVIVGDIDPKQFIKENIDIVHGIHFKDMDKDFKNKSGLDIFAVLGDGCIDVKGIMQLEPDDESLPVVIDQDVSKGDFIADLRRSAKLLYSIRS